MSAFKNKAVKILIGTDIISRGIDVVGIELVINYDTPGDPEDYVHRVGRTARADKEGEAITFVNPKDQQKFVRIEKLIGMSVTQNPLPEGFERGPEYHGEKAKPTSAVSGPPQFKKKKKKKKPNRPQGSESPRPEQARSEQPKPHKPRPQAPSSPQAESKPAQSKESTTSKYGQRKNVIEP